MSSTNLTEILPTVTQDKAHFLSFLHNLLEAVAGYDTIGDANLQPET
jgi:hypothetical protein